MKRIALVFCVTMTSRRMRNDEARSRTNSVLFITAKDGATVTSPFKVVFGVKAWRSSRQVMSRPIRSAIITCGINLGPMACRRGDSRRRCASALRQGADRSGDQAAARQLQAYDAVRQWCARLLRATHGGERHGAGANRWRSESAPSPSLRVPARIAFTAPAATSQSSSTRSSVSNNKTASATTDGSAVDGRLAFFQLVDKVGIAAQVNELSIGCSMYIHVNGNCNSLNAASAGPVWTGPGRVERGRPGHRRPARPDRHLRAGGSFGKVSGHRRRRWAVRRYRRSRRRARQPRARPEARIRRSAAGSVWRHSNNSVDRGRRR